MLIVPHKVLGSQWIISIKHDVRPRGSYYLQGRGHHKVFRMEESWKSQSNPDCLLNSIIRTSVLCHVSSPSASVNEQSSIHLAVDFSRLCAWPTNVFSTQLSHTPLGFFIWSTSFLCFWEEYPSSLPHPELLLVRQAGSTRCTTGQWIREMRCWSAGNNFIWKATDQEDGRLAPQNNHLIGSGCQVLLWIRDGDR